MITLEALAAYTNHSLSDGAFLDACRQEAHQLLLTYVGDAAVPVAVFDRATLEVGSELVHRRNAPQGIAQFSTFDGPPVRVARDPMVGAYPLLRPYVRGGFA